MSVRLHPTLSTRMFHQPSQNVIYTVKSYCGGMLILLQKSPVLHLNSLKPLGFNELSCPDISLCASSPVVNMYSDYDECGMGVVCENGMCVNTAGSFNCFCSPPLVLDGTRRRCVSLNTTEGTAETKTMDCASVDLIRLRGPNFRC